MSGPADLVSRLTAASQEIYKRTIRSTPTWIHFSDSYIEGFSRKTPLLEFTEEVFKETEDA